MSVDLFLGEHAERRRQRDDDEAEHEFWKLVPQERGLVLDGLRFALGRPVDRVGEHDEADGGVARGLGEHGDLAGLLGPKIAGGGCLGGVVDRKARPEAVGVIAQASAWPISGNANRPIAPSARIAAMA